MPSHQSSFARFTGSVVGTLLALTLSACSAAPDGEANVSASEAATSCPSGLVYKCSIEYGLQKQCVCDVPDSIVDTAYPPSGVPAGVSREACGAATAPIPSALANLGCTLGMAIKGDPIWACPSANVSLAALPATFGVIDYGDGSTRSFPACSPQQPPDCERIGLFTQLRSNCLGSARPGWVFVWDHLVWSGAPQGCDGSCVSGPGPWSAGPVNWH